MTQQKQQLQKINQLLELATLIGDGDVRDELLEHRESVVKALAKGSKRTYVTYLFEDKASGWVKVGKTIDLRKRILSHRTSNPTIDRLWIIEDLTENQAHELLQGFRINNQPGHSEFFKVSRTKALEILGQRSKVSEWSLNGDD